MRRDQSADLAHGKRVERTRLLGIGLWGATTTLTAYLLAFGSLLLFVANLIAIGILLRMVAWAVMRRRGKRPPRWWWL